MAQAIPDYIPPGAEGLAKSHEGKFPDWIPPTADEKVAKQYAAVKRCFEWNQSNGRSKDKPFGCASMSEWCEKFGHDEGKVLLTCLKMNLIEPCVYEEFVRGRQAVDVAPVISTQDPNVPRGVGLALAMGDHLRGEVEARVDAEARAQAEAELDAFAGTEGDEVPQQAHRGRRRKVSKP